MVAMNTSAWLMKEVKILLGSHAIQNLAMTVPHFTACVMVKEQEGNEIMVIVKEFFEHGIYAMLFKIFRKSFIIIIAILKCNAEYDYFIQKKVGRELT